MRTSDETLRFPASDFPNFFAGRDLTRLDPSKSGGKLEPPRNFDVEYLPEIAALDYGVVPSPEEVAETLGTSRVEVVPVPWDCTDGFLGAYWRRPGAYLEPSVRGYRLVVSG